MCTTCALAAVGGTGFGVPAAAALGTYFVYRKLSKDNRNKVKKSNKNKVKKSNKNKVKKSNKGTKKRKLSKKYRTKRK